MKKIRKIRILDLWWGSSWMDEDATCMVRHIVLDGIPALRERGTAAPHIFGPCVLWPRSPSSATAELLFHSTFSAFEVSYKIALHTSTVIILLLLYDLYRLVENGLPIRRSNIVAWAEAYLHTEWHRDASSRLVCRHLYTWTHTLNRTRSSASSQWSSRRRNSLSSRSYLRVCWRRYGPQHWQHAAAYTAVFSGAPIKRLPQYSTDA